MTKRLRAVLDTNVFVSAFLSRSPTSPTRELIQRWLDNEFTLLVSDAILDELAVHPVITADPDDDHILACAVVARADYLVSYDPHFAPLNGTYQGVTIVKALPFLWALRNTGDATPT